MSSRSTITTVATAVALATGVGVLSAQGAGPARGASAVANNNDQAGAGSSTNTNRQRASGQVTRPDVGSPSSTPPAMIAPDGGSAQASGPDPSAAPLDADGQPEAPARAPARKPGKPSIRSSGTVTDASSAGSAGNNGLAARTDRN